MTAPDRWPLMTARAALAAGLAASLGANIMAAHPTALGRIVAAWAPVALMVAVELLTRVPVGRSALSAVRTTSAAVIAAIAAWVSYWHMVELATMAGESTVTAHLLPLSVDGLVIVASVTLHQLRRHGIERPAAIGPERIEVERIEVERRPLAPASVATPRQGPSGQRGGSGTASSIQHLAAAHPEWTQAQLAEAAGVSVRTVRRHLAEAAPAAEVEGRQLELVGAAR